MKEKSRRELVRSRSFQRINGLTQRTPVHKITTRFNAKKESIFILDSKSDKYHYTEWAQNGFERQDISHGVQRCPTLSHVVPRCPTLSHVVQRCPTVTYGAAQSVSSKILFAAFGDTNRTAAQFLAWYRFPKINPRINFLENDANYQVSPRGGDYARDPPMGYLSLYIHLDIQPIGRMSRYDST